MCSYFMDLEAVGAHVGQADCSAGKAWHLMEHNLPID